MSTPLEGRTALVTGAGRGIGRAIALQLAGAGVSVALVARSRDQLEETAGRVRELGGDAFVLPADLAELSEVSRVAQRAATELEGIDILVNNAAVVEPLGSSAGLDVGEWSAAIGLNVVAAAALSFALLPAMLAHGWGRILNVSSGVVAHPEGMVGANAYATGKAALEAHTVNLAAELSETGVTANVFRPGSVDTAMQSWIRAQDPARIGTALSAWFHHSFEEGRLITPERSARALLGRLGGELNGQIWDVADGA